MHAAVALSVRDADSGGSVTVPRLLRLGALLLALLALAMPVGPAGAVAPDSLEGPITDLAGVLPGGDDVSTISDAFATIEDQHGVRLHVVFVDTFGGEDPFEWADATFAATGLGSRDFLFAAAMEDRAYGYVVQDGFPLGDPALGRAAAAATPHLAENAVRASTEMAAAMGGEFNRASHTSADDTGGSRLTAAIWIVGGIGLAPVLAFTAVSLWRRPVASPFDPAKPRGSVARSRSTTTSCDWDSYSSPTRDYGASSSRSSGGGSRGGSGSF
jgi:uncharacterized membrane protein YgcG